MGCGIDSKTLILNVKYQKNIPLQIDNSYDTFLEKILKEFKLSSQNLKFLSLTYIDEKNNTIIISNEKDYNTFYAKLKKKLIKNSLNINEKLSSDSNNIILEAEVHPGGSTNTNQFIQFLEKAKEGICKINTKINGENAHGTGFFTKIEVPQNEDIEVLFTCNHVLTKEYLDNNSKINIEINNNKKGLELKNRRIWSDSELDYTCIEILKNDNIKTFLSIDENILKSDYPIENYKNNGIYIFAFMKDYELGFDSGDIVKVENNFLFYNCNTYGGSSGGVIINRTTNNIIAIHRGSTKNSERIYNFGIYMKPIINDIKSKKENIKINFYFSVILMGDADSGKYEFLEKIEEAKNVKPNEIPIATNKIVKSENFNALIQFWDYDFLNSEKYPFIKILRYNKQFFQLFLQENLFDKIILFYDSRNKNTFKNLELNYEKIKKFGVKKLILENTFNQENKNIKEISDDFAKNFAKENNIEFLEFIENNDINEFLTKLVDIMALTKILDSLQNPNDSIEEKSNRIKNELGEMSITPTLRIRTNKDFINKKDNNNNE